MQFIKSNRPYRGTIVFERTADGQMEIRTRVSDQSNVKHVVRIDSTPHGTVKVTPCSVIANFIFKDENLSMSEVAEILENESSNIAERLACGELDDRIDEAREMLAKMSNETAKA